MFKMINTWIKRAIQKIKGKPKEEYDTYSIPNGPTFYVPKNTTPPGVNDNVSWKIPEDTHINLNGTPVRPIPVRPNPPPKADTDGDVVSVHSVDNMLMPLGLDEDELKLTKEEIKEVDTKIDNWYDKKSANETLKEVAEEFKQIQKNPKYHEDISPLLSGAAVSNKEIIDDIANAIREVTKPNNDTKKPAQKKRRKRTNSKKKSGEKK